MKFSFLKLTLFFSVIGIFIPVLASNILFLSQRLLSLVGLECSNAWTIIWALSGLFALVLPILFFRHISKRSEGKIKGLVVKLILFNLIEYILIQSCLTPLFTRGHSICYGVDGQNGLEMIYTAWLALPILVSFSMFFDKKFTSIDLTLNIRKWMYAFGSIVVLFYLITVYNRYITNPWNSQLIANQQKSTKSTESKRLEGKKNCNCASIHITLNENTIERNDSVVNNILNKKTQFKRILHYLIGSYDPYRLQSSLIPKLDYDPAAIEMGGVLQKAKVKLTGGQADHFLTEKRSLRFKLKDTLLGMTKFNLYNPFSRIGGLYEWVNIELMKAEGLIGLETGYLDVTINNKNKGIYFYQEQPTIETLLNNNKTPGLIIRIGHYEEDGVQRIEIENYYDEKSLPSKEFFNAQNAALMRKVEAYNKGKIGIEEIVSIPKMSMYLALIDLSNGYHGSQLRNIYFYMNPDNSLLEPIGREFASNFYNSTGSNYFYPFELTHFDAEKSMYTKQIFLSKTNDFEEQYNAYLNKVSEANYLKAFFNKVNVEFMNRQYCLYKGEPTIKSFSKDHYYNNQALIREFLNSK